MSRVSLVATFLIALTLALLPAAPLTAQTHHDTQHHSFQGADQWAKEFDDPTRDEWQKPHEVIQALALKPEALIADIGSGTGTSRCVSLTWCRRASLRGGHRTRHGKVPYRACKKHGPPRTAVQAAADDPRLAEKVDLIIIVDTFHHIENRARYLRRLHDSLKPDGRIAIIDFRIDSPDGPPKSARSTPDQIKAELNGAGYAFVQEHNFLPKQYFLVFEQAKK